ncbi:hypothetical protein BH10CYA1_BH10CYA1_63450 [soil metagenome]
MSFEKKIQWSEPVPNESSGNRDHRNFTAEVQAAQTIEKNSSNLGDRNPSYVADPATKDALKIVDDRARDLAKPAVAGLTARAVYLALSGQLYVDEHSIARNLSKIDSPVAKQVLDTMGELKANDWNFVKGPANWKTGGAYEPFTRRVWYSTNGWRGELQHMLGAGNSPVQKASVIFAHEIGHHDQNRVTYSVHPSESEASLVMAKRHLLTETRAMITEVHIGQQSGTVTPCVLARQTALQTGTLADHIVQSHPNSAGLQPAEARKFVNEYIDKTYGKNLIDPVNGSVRSFDMRAGFGQNKVATLAEDAEFVSMLNTPGQYKVLREEPLFEFRNLTVKDRPMLTKLLQKTKFVRAGEGSILPHIMGYGGRAVGAVCLVLAANDVINQYQLSVGAGTGRLGRIATDWAGFEAGGRAARFAAAAMKVHNPYISTALVLGAGIVASNALDLAVGETLESSMRKVSS